MTVVLPDHGRPPYELAFDGDGEFVTPIGSGNWLPGVWAADPDLPLVSAGGCQRGRLIADIRFVRTPHLLRITLDPPTRSFRASRREQPLHGPDRATLATRMHRFGGPSISSSGTSPGRL